MMETPGLSLHELSLLLHVDLNNEIMYNFKRLKTVEERIHYAITLLAQQDYTSGINVEGFKSLSKSIKLRREGNDAYKTGNFNTALLHYTKALAYAPHGDVDKHRISSGEMKTACSLAFANRSAVLLNLKKYEECLKDISLALLIGYPRDLEYKLHLRKLKCKLAIGKLEEIDETLQYAIKSLSLNDTLTESQRKSVKCELDNVAVKIYDTPNNSKTDTVSKTPLDVNLEYLGTTCFDKTFDCVEVRAYDDMGHGLFATRDIDIGEVIAIEPPFGSMLKEDYIYTNCSHCCKPSMALRPCLHCSMAMYCSEKCLKFSWVLYHYLDCQLLPYLSHYRVLPTGIRAMRTIFLAKKLNNTLSELYETVKSYDKCDKEANCSNLHVDAIDPNINYFRAHKAVTNSEYKSLEINVFCYLYSAFLTSILEKKSDFFLEDVKDEENHDVSVDELKTFIAGLFFKYIQHPSHQVYENRFIDSGETVDLTAVGDAVYPISSLINHSCDPNVFRYSCFGNLNIIRALRNIAEGEQIFDCYGPHYGSTPLEERQIFLRTEYFFTCKCIACTERWPTILSMKNEEPRLKCKSCGNMLPEFQKLPKTVICSNCHEEINATEVASKIKNIKTQMCLHSRSSVSYNDILQNIHFLSSHCCKPSFELVYSQEILKNYFYGTVCIDNCYLINQ